MTNLGPPEPPFRSMLDRDFAVAGASELLECASALLQTVVNHATHAYQRCRPTAPALEDEHLAPFMLYRQVIEMTDAVDVLLQGSCGTPCVPLLRSAFEASLGLEYILQGNSRRRAQAWYVGHIREKLRAYRSMISSSPEGAQAEKAWEEQFHEPRPAIDDVANAIAAFEGVLKQEALQVIVAEFVAREKGRPRRVEWFSLFDGPPNRRVLAGILKRGAEYDSFYRPWTRLTHAEDLSSFVSLDLPGFVPIRYAGEIQNLALAATHIQLHSTRVMLREYRSGESISAWYLREVKPRRETLLSLRIEIIPCA